MKSFSPFKTPKGKQFYMAQNNNQCNPLDQKRPSTNSIQGHSQSVLSKSMNLASFNKTKCTFHAHQQQDVTHICLLENCNKASRLACAKCLSGFHVDHAQYMVQISSFIYSGRLFDPLDASAAVEYQNSLPYTVENWPTDSTARQMKDFILGETSHAEALFEDLETYFKGLEKNILIQLDQIKQKFKFEVQAYYKRGEGKKKVEFIENLKKKYEGSYGLKELQLSMQNFLNREVSSEVLAAKVQYFLSSRESQQARLQAQNFFLQNLENSSKAPQICIEKHQLICIEKIMNECLSKVQQCLMQPLSDCPIPVPVGLKRNVASVQTKEKQLLGVVEQEQKDDIWTWVEEFEDVSHFLTSLLKKKNEKRDVISYATEIYADGSKYEGFFLNGARQFFGSRFFLDGSVYTGEWQGGCRNGKGIMYYHNGSTYQGQWQEDKKAGLGKEIASDGRIFEGIFQNDMKNGAGRQTFLDGKIYEGEFRNDKRVGEGKLVLKNGTVQKVNVEQLTDSQKKTLTQENK